MSAFSSKETCSLERKTDVGVEVVTTDLNSLSDVYELERCVKWIQEIGAKKVCLQFPDSLLCDSVNVATHLEQRIDGRVSILGDTSYGSCCVDEVAAQHFAADAVVHFGHACLSPTTRLPVLYVFEKRNIDVQHFITCFRETFTEECDVLLLYEVRYHHAIAAISRHVSSRCVISHPASHLDHADVGPGSTRKLGRVFTLAADKQVSDYRVVFVGQDGRTWSNFLLDMRPGSCYLYDPVSGSGIARYSHEPGRFLSRRLYLVERVKDAATLGVVVGTLGVSNYLSSVERIKQLAKKSDKKCYVIAVGKPNPPKLANFPEVDVFVLIACADNSLLDSKEFYRPIVTPYDVELAVNPALQVGLTYVTDFRDMLAGGPHHVSVDDMQDQLADMSLISGRLRPPPTPPSVDQSASSQAVSLPSDATVAIPASTGSRFLANRSWAGLNQQLGETEVTTALQGRSGIASNYSEMS